MTIQYRALLAIILLSSCLWVSSAYAVPYDLGAGSPYALIQLGNDGWDSTSWDDASDRSGGDKLEITSNSSVFGSTLKGEDDKDELNKITTSKVTGSWEREQGVDKDFSSSYRGGANSLSSSEFNSVGQDARETSQYWAGQSGTDIAIDLNNSNMTLTGTTGGANVYNLTSDFSLNSWSKLTLTGGEGDFFIFNISEDLKFKLNSNSIIELRGDILASEVLFNVLGNIGETVDDEVEIASGSIFQGTLLTPGRKVKISQNHFHTFDSGDYEGTEAPETTEITAADAIFEKESSQGNSSWGGLFGQVVAGGAIDFSESDISYEAFDVNPVPVPTSVLLLGSGVIGLVGFRRKRSS